MSMSLRINTENAKYAWCEAYDISVLLIYYKPLSIHVIAAEGSLLFLTCFSRTSPFPVGRTMYSRMTTRFYMYVRMISLWRHRNNILQIAIWLSEYPGWDSRTPLWTITICKHVYTCCLVSVPCTDHRRVVNFDSSLLYRNIFLRVAVYRKYFSR
jgi:hypothetical protein